ncbi:hypothetical protein [Catenulispora rubra]|uniref:hypothetical protein n=1 Tax=Catenulispora rubra TaxID=280293 RepID=UPI0018923E4B|nr:hypothetical protein [Catenulispora rubra]
MGTEHPDTERMHRLFGDALDDVDLTGDVVPTVLTGYRHRVRIRRYQGAGVALAVLATAGVAVSALPRGTGTGTGTDAGMVTPGTAPAKQYTGYCEHRQWVAIPSIEVISVNALAPDAQAAADQANCKALQTALQSVYPTVQIVPQFNPDLTRDPRVDQSLLKRIDANKSSDPGKWSADTAKNFGAELKYLAVHPEDPANTYMPDQYEIVTAAGRESLGVSRASDATVPNHPEVFVGLAESDNCANIPSVLVGKIHCTPVGVAAGWHGALWDTPPGGVNAAQQTGVVTNGRGTAIELWGDGNDYQAWYHEGMYTVGMGGMGSGLPGNTWINRWTGQTYEGDAPPSLHALTDAQWAQFLNAPAFQKFADSYLAYLSKLPTPQHGAPSPTRSH